MDEKKAQGGFRLGEIMIQKGWITWEQLEEALNIQALKGEAKDVLTFKPRKPGNVLNLGEILIQHGWISWAQLAEVLQIQKASGRFLGEILIEKKYITKKDMFRGLAIQASVAFVDFDKITVPPEVLALVSKRVALDNKIIPLVKKGRELLVATSAPKTITLEPHNFPPECEIKLVMATPEDIEKALQQYYGG